MGLASALSTSLTGLNAAETTIDVVGNNLANSNTVGFKASQASFATQFLQTQSLGSSPTTNSGGSNPRQIGLGTMVADITPNFSQGTIEISSQPTDMAIQGDGFFMVQGNSGERLYTRNGIFKMNSQSEMTTVTGNRLLGYGTDDQFEIQRTVLQPIKIPLGSAAVAQPTQNVYLEGTLTPTGDVATAASIIQTGVLGNSQYRPPNTVGFTPMADVGPDVGSVTAAGSSDTQGMTAGGVYSYRYAFYDSTGTNGETNLSAEIGLAPITLGALQEQVSLTNLPAAASIPPGYDTIQLYRTTPGGSTYYLIPGYVSGDTTYTDQTADAGLGAAFAGPSIGGPNEVAIVPAEAAGGALTPNTDYLYKFAFYDSVNGVESQRSGAKLVHLNVGENEVDFTNLPAVGSYPVGYDTLRIYRTPAGAAEPYKLVTEVTPPGTASYNDIKADSALTWPAGFDVTGTGETAGGMVGPGLLTANGIYRYKIVFYNQLSATCESESIPSSEITVTLTPGEDEISLTIPSFPPANTGIYDRFRVYRTIANNSNQYYRILDQPLSNLPINNYIDVASDASLLALPESQRLNNTLLDFNYSYYMTFYDASGIESRPSEVIGPFSINDGRVQLRDLPVPAVGDHPSNGWIGRRIYRNLASDPASFHRLAEISNTTADLTYTDGTSDTDLAAQPLMNADGAVINNGTLLINVQRRDGSVYEPVFQVGTLEFTGRKGGRSLTTKDFQITATSTVQDLMTFMEQAMGIQIPPGNDPYHVIPGSTHPAGMPGTPGGSVNGGRICFVGNNGRDNALDIGLSGLQLVTTSGTETVDMPFNAVQQAVGESAVTDFIAYDSLGIPIKVRLTMVMESRTSAATTYRWFGDSSDNDPITGAEIAVGTGLISFDGLGNFVSATESTMSIDRRHISAQSPLQFELNFAQLSGLAADKSSLAVSRQDGSAPGVLTSFIIGEDGTIRGVFSNGVTRDLAQIRLARFGNPAGLEQKGENMYAGGVNSGLPVEGNPGEQGIGTIIAGATELSNTDIGANLIDLILASTMYRGNTRVITTVQQMLDELLALRR